MTALLVVVILVFLIIVHELGHFIAAKITGVRVEEFGLGYPPRAFIFGKLRDTEYTLNWLPFGGFVRLAGEDGETARAPGTLLGASRRVQALILVAGVVMNVIAAWALFAGALSLGMPRVVDEPGLHSKLIVSEVVAGSPADVAGLQSGDVLLSVRDAAGVSLAALSPKGVLQYVEKHGGVALTVSYAREEEKKEAVIRPAHGVLPTEAGRPAIGVALTLIDDEPLQFTASLIEASRNVWASLKSVLSGLSTIIIGALTGRDGVLQEVVGPVGLAGVVGAAAKHGLPNVLALAAFISVNLAVINLIPIPALDGGRLLMLGIEGAVRRRIPNVVVQLANTAGFALVVILMLVVTYHDIARLIA